MQKTSDYYVVKQKAVPEVLLKVVEAKRPAGIRKSGDNTGCGGEEWISAGALLQI